MAYGFSNHTTLPNGVSQLHQGLCGLHTTTGSLRSHPPRCLQRDPGGPPKAGGDRSLALPRETSHSYAIIRGQGDGNPTPLLGCSISALLRQCSCLADAEATQGTFLWDKHRQIGASLQTGLGAALCTGAGAGVGWVQSTLCLVGHNQGPVLSPTPRSSPLPNPALSISLPGVGCHVQGGRCCTFPPTKSRSTCSSFSQGSHNIIQHSSSKSPPEPSTNRRHQCRPAGKVTAHPRSRPSTPTAAHQHTQTRGLYFRSRLPRAKYPRNPPTPWGFKKTRADTAAAKRKGGKAKERTDTV